MGRVLVIFGIILVFVGILGSIWAFTAPLVNPTNAMFNPGAGAVQAAQAGPDAATLCNPGERVIQENGPSDRDPVTGDSRHPVQVYCVDGAGNRREVTGQYAGNLVGQALQSIPKFIGGIGLSVCLLGLVFIGIMLALIGALVGRHEQPNPVPVVGMTNNQVYPPVPSGTASFAPSSPPPVRPAATDLTGKLRELEAARSQGLLSEDEYQRLRQQILDRMS